VRAAPILAALVALAAGALVLAGCGRSTAQGSADTNGGKAMFTQSCGGCHTLADAGTTAQIGPNLDWALGFAREQGFNDSTLYEVVLRQIELPNENGGMPANVVAGQDAVDVAAYVAKVAGTNGVLEGGGASGGAGGATDGKTIFTQNCASCHTLKAAGTTGTVGPNLDEAKPSKSLVVDRVTNGKGVMPSFKDVLQPAQIDAVADFVSTNAGK
jgi:cbb3-type cytochrome c oxidase subunit III